MFRQFRRRRERPRPVVSREYLVVGLAYRPPECVATFSEAESWGVAEFVVWECDLRGRLPWR